MTEATLFLLLFRFFLFLELIIDYDKKVHSVKNEFLDTGVNVSLIRLSMNYLDEEKHVHFPYHVFPGTFFHSTSIFLKTN